MEKEARLEVFKNELAMIKDDRVRSFVIVCLREAPDYFFEMPASTTGKYHPAYALGEGGLVRHTKAAVKIARDLLSLEQNKLFEEDLIIAALILHDIKKKGNDEAAFTAFDHPLCASDFVIQIGGFRMFQNNEELAGKIFTIARLIRSHMGQWNTDKKSKVKLPVPECADEEFVHMCDYLASRKYLICEFEGDAANG